MARAARTKRVVKAVEDRTASANYHAQALARGLGLLEQMSMHTQPLELTDFVETTALPKSTVVRLLSVLCELGYAVRIDERPTFRLGYKVQRLAAAYVSSLDLSDVAKDYLIPLSMSTGQTANLGVLDGDQVVHVCVSEPDRLLRFRAAVGTSDHAYCTGLGKVLLAYLPPERLVQSIPPAPFTAFTPQTITTAKALATDLHLTRKRGYAVDDNERSAGLRCVAVPVEIDGECLAAVSVSGPSGEFSHEQQKSFAAELREVSAALASDHEVVAALKILHQSSRESTQNSDSDI